MEIRVVDEPIQADRRFERDLDAVTEPVLADRSWFVATEIDFDPTIVAGSSELIAAVLAEPILEAWPVDPDDSLARDGDTLNA
jgi:hypothetical protein